MERRKCEVIVEGAIKIEDLRTCKRYATHAVLFMGQTAEYVCTQHAKEIQRVGLSDSTRIVEMQETR